MNQIGVIEPVEMRTNFNAMTIAGEERKMFVKLLKVSPGIFKEISNGMSNFEIRRNDRHFSVGDVVVFSEYENECYLGGILLVEVTGIRKVSWRRNRILLEFKLRK